MLLSLDLVTEASAEKAFILLDIDSHQSSEAQASYKCTSFPDQ